MLQNSQGKLSPQGEADLSANTQHEQHEAERMKEDLQDDSKRSATKPFSAWAPA